MPRSLSLMDGQLIIYDGVGDPTILNGKALGKWKKVMIILVFTLEILTQEKCSLESKFVDSTNLKVTVLVFTLDILTLENYYLKSKSSGPTKLKETMLVFTPEILTPESKSPDPAKLKEIMLIFTPDILTPKNHSLELNLQTLPGWRKQCSYSL